MPLLKVLAGLILVTVAALLASADSLQLASELQPDPWGVESAQQRFANVATRLPPQDVVGYISDLPILTSQGGAPAFLAAQYALAPRLLTPVEQSAPQQAVGNFSKSADYAEIGAKLGYIPVEDFGNGVVLYRKK